MSTSLHSKTALNILDAIYTLCSSIPSLHSASPSLSTGGRLRAWKKGREALHCDYSSWRRLIISINHSWFLTDIDADELPSLQWIKLPHQQSIRPPGPNMTFDPSHFSRHKIIHHVAVLYATKSCFTLFFWRKHLDNPKMWKQFALPKHNSGDESE